MGEATVYVSQDIKQKYPEFQWKNVIGMRNILAHQYFKIDLDMIWLTIENYLPLYHKIILNILSELSLEKTD